MQGCYHYSMKRIILLGPILFAVVLVALTLVKYEFLRGLGWHPINDPTFDWPSGLALGKYGWIMTATFIASGLLMTLFAARLFLDLEPARTVDLSYPHFISPLHERAWPGKE